MIKQIFVNLPVADLKASIAFFTRLGFTFNPQFTDETGTCMIVGENIFAMVREAVAAGGNTYSAPLDHGFMVQHGFQDLDGHVWEVFQMNPQQGD
jgi:predicted lactoylglutathione lyase